MKDERCCSPKHRRLFQAFILHPSAFILCLLSLLSPALADQAGSPRPADRVSLLTDQNYYQSLIGHIDRAKERIDLAMYLFKVTDSPRNKSFLLVKELAKARQRGVLVTVVLEKSNYNESINRENSRVAELLRSSQIDVRFDSLRTTTHSKMVIIDGRYCFIGSHNFTHSALGRNHEVSVLIDDRNLATQLLSYIASID